MAGIREVKMTKSEELRHRRRTLENDIKNRIREFEEETGLHLSQVVVTNGFVGGDYNTYGVVNIRTQVLL